MVLRSRFACLNKRFVVVHCLSALVDLFGFADRLLSAASLSKDAPFVAEGEYSFLTPGSAEMIGLVGAKEQCIVTSGLEA